MSNSFETEQAEVEVDSIAKLAEHCVYRLPGCVDVMVRKELQRAYYDFCRLTCCLTSTKRIPLLPGRRVYEVSPSVNGMRVDTVRSVRVDGRFLRPGEYAARDGRIELTFFEPPPPRDASPVARSIYTDVRTPPPRPEFHRPAPSVMEVVAVELPRFGSEDAPQGFIDRYGEAVVAGTLMRLMGMTGKPWTDTAQAQSEALTWENFLTTARLDSMTDGTNNGHVETVDMSGML